MENAGGPFSIRYNKARALLAYLAMEGGFHTREALALLLWPDATAQVGRENLRRMLFVLKDALAGDAVESTRDVLRLRVESGVWTDVAVFTDLLSAKQRTLAMGAAVNSERLAHAVSLYRGEFLQGLELDDAPEFGNWLEMRREQYRQRYLQALGMLVEAHEREGNPHAAIERAQQWTSLAPLDSKGWQQLLRLLVETDQRDRARQEFQRYRHVMDMELGAPPDAAVAALLESPSANRFGAVANRSSGTGERRQLTALSCEFYVTGEPEDVAESLLGWMTCCESHFRGAGAYIVRTPGGLIAYFGYPAAQEDAARRAVTAALACRDGLEARQAQDGGAVPMQVQIGLGVHTGIVISSVEEGIPDAGGKVARLALLLGAMSATSGVVVSEAALRLLNAAFSATPIGQLNDGASGMQIPAFLISDARGQEPLTTQRLLCGREKELAQLNAIGRKRGSHVCVVRGEAGLGKSFLVEHFCHARQAECVVLRCVSELRQMPFHPFVRWMQRLREKSGAQGLRSDEVVHLLDAIGQRMLPADHPAWNLLQFRGREELESLFYDLLDAVVPAGGVICLDDAHWADPSTREVLASLVEKPLPGRMVIVTARPEFVLPWRQVAPIHELELQPLDDTAVAELVRSVMHGEAIDDELLHEIVRLSEGIPFYAEELTRDFLAARPRSGTPRILPASLNDLLMARIDSVGRARRVAQFAAVVGGEFNIELLAEVMDEPRGRLAEAIAVMLRQNIIVRRGDHAYAFRHALLREAAYQSQTRMARMQAHARLAHLIESGQQRDRSPEVLAWHYAGAGNRTQAVRYLLEAARKAAAQCAYREAVSYYRSALEWFEGEGEGGDAIMEELRIRMELGIQLSALHGLGSDLAVESFRSALAVAQPLGDDPQLFPIYWGLWSSSSSWANFSMALALGETLLRLAETSGDNHLLTHAHYARGYSYFFLGKFAEAVADLERGVQCYPARSANTMLGQDGKVTNLALLSLAYWHVGRFEDALQACRAALAHARRLGHRYSLLYALVLASDLHRLNRDIDKVSVFSREATAVARELDAPLLRICVETSEAWVGVARGCVGDLDEMAACVQRVQSVMKGLTPFLVSRWVDACDMAEAVVPGLDTVTLGLKAVEQTNARYVQSEFERIKGKLLFRQGASVDVFMPWLERALATARALDSPPLVLRALTSLVRYAGVRPQPAHLALLADTVARVQGGKHTWEVRAARDLLTRYRTAATRSVR